MKTTIVVGYDRTPAGELALVEAARDAGRRSASLVVLTAYHWPPSSTAATGGPADAPGAAAKGAEDTARRGADRVQDLFPDVAVEARPVEGHAGRVLGAVTHEADVLVVGHRGGGGFEGMTLGSTAMRAIAEACCPVLVVRAVPVPAHDRVVAAVDIDEPCDEVLDFAFDEAARRGAHLTVVHVWDEPWVLAYGLEDPGVTDDIVAILQEREDRLADLIRDVQRRHPRVQAFRQVATGSAGALLVEASQRADLLVTGARRHGVGLHGVQIGPVTATLLHHAACAVAVVPLG